jgi:RNA polymerase sigma factor (sigma-70 family)
MNKKPKRQKAKYQRLTLEQQNLVESHYETLNRMLARDPAVKNIVKLYDSFEDARQTALVGVMIAASKFDPDRGLQFWTYAWHWVRQSLCNFKPGSTRFHFICGRDHDGMIHCVRQADLESPTDDSFGASRLELMTSISERHEEKLVALEKINQGMKAMPARWRKVLMMRARGYRLDDIAGELGISRERVRQLENNARKKFMAAVEP